MTTAINQSPLLDSFEDAIIEAKLKNSQRSAQLLSNLLVPITVSFDAADPFLREQSRQQMLTELQEAVAIAMGGSATGNTLFQLRPGQTPPRSSTPKVGSHLIMRAIERQGNFMASRHRAAVLRHGTFVRRVVHTVARRNSHSDTGGFFDRRVETPVVDTLKRALQ